MSHSRLLRSFDAFAKPLEGTRTRTVAGGIITVLSYAAAGSLLAAQLYLYARGEVRHSLHLAESSSSPVLARPYGGAYGKRGGGGGGGGGGGKGGGLLEVLENQAMNKIPLRVHVTFPHIKCRDLDYAHDGAAKSNGEFQKLHGRDALQLRIPSRKELDAALGGGGGQRRPNDACTVKGAIQIPRVGGSLSVTVSKRAWTEVTNVFAFGAGRDARMSDEDAAASGRLHNCSHYIHSITFGEPFPLVDNPLSDVIHVIDNESGVALNNIFVKLVPTVYSRSILSGGTRRTYQASVAQHIVQPQTLAAQRSPMLPGVSVGYDFTPLAVHHVEGRENPFVFLGSLVSIVGGVFVTVGLVTGCLVNSAAAVAKKMD